MPEVVQHRREERGEERQVAAAHGVHHAPAREHHVQRGEYVRRVGLVVVRVVSVARLDAQQERVKAPGVDAEPAEKIEALREGEGVTGGRGRASWEGGARSRQNP